MSKALSLVDVLQRSLAQNKEDITPELLLDELNDDDFDIIDAQINAVKKKRMDLNKNSPATEPSSSHSDDTGSVSSKSEA